MARPKKRYKALLIEPNYSNKFPPIGLMKIATYHKNLGNWDVVFYKGDLKQFIIEQIADKCIAAFNKIDKTQDWYIRKDFIFEYIKTRKSSALDAIGTEQSPKSEELRSIAIDFKDFYWKGTWKNYPEWDRVFVTTLFTFYWKTTIETIEFAKLLVKKPKDLMVGGVLASIQPKEIEEATGIKPHVGTLHTPYVDIEEDNPYIIDELPLDYSILDEIEYEYPDRDAFYSYSTRGCIRHCPFCAVPTLEPTYQPYLPLYERISRTRRLYGDKRNLLLMDNNVLASDNLPEIIEDIKKCGFGKNSTYIEPNQYNLAIRNLRLGLNDRAYIRKTFKLLSELNDKRFFNEETRTKIYSLREENGLLHLETCTKENLIRTYKDFAEYFDKVYKRQRGRQRIVDFNQGVDARLFNEERVNMLAQIPIRPLRIAFDNIKTEHSYMEAIRMSAQHGIRDFSNYLLYNFNDTPQELYYRLRVNVDLCEELDVNVYSFPMKYHPIRDEHSHDRDYIGKNWNRKYIRAVQAILNATKGKVGRGISFFEKAFGKNEEEFMELLIMPETFLLFRFFFEHLGYTDQWRKAMAELTDSERDELYPIIFHNDFNHIEELTSNEK